MAKTNNTQATNTRNSDKMAKGTLSPDMLKRHKLKGNISDPVVVSASRNNNTVKKFARMIKTYRQIVHNVTEPRLCSSLRMTAHYFSVPMTRSDNDNNNRDKRSAVDVANVENINATNL